MSYHDAAVLECECARLTALRGISEDLIRVMIKTVTLQDFMCFEGEYVVDFDLGLNIVHCDRHMGDCFFRALQFAHIGGAGYLPEVIGGLVNRESFDRGERSWGGGLVDIRYAKRGEEYIVQRGFSPLWGGVSKETVVYSNDNPLIRNDSWNRYAYVERLLLSESPCLSRGRDTLKALMTILRLNKAEDIGFMVLNGSLISLEDELYEEALHALRDLDQIILIDKRTSGGSRVMSLGETVDTVVFKVPGSPDEPNLLLDGLGVQVYNRYLCSGDRFTVFTNGGPIVVEVVSVEPDGTRYVRGVSRIELS